VLTPESKQFEKIVDSTITFIQKFARAITLPDKRIQWLHFRGADGLFPREIFDYTVRADF